MVKEKNKSMHYLLGIVEKQDKSALLFIIGILMSALGAILAGLAWQNFLLRAKGGIAGVLSNALGWNNWYLTMSQNPILLWLGIIVFGAIGIALFIDGLNMVLRALKMTK